MDFVGHGVCEMAQEVTGAALLGLAVQLDEGELRGAVDGDEHVELALGGAQFGEVDMNEPDGVALELALG